METLVGLLVSTVCLLMLFFAVVSSVRMVRTSRERMEDIYAGESLVALSAAHGEGGVDGTCSLSLALTRNPDGVVHDVGVLVYVDECTGGAVSDVVSFVPKEVES